MGLRAGCKQTPTTGLRTCFEQSFGLVRKVISFAKHTTEYVLSAQAFPLLREWIARTQWGEKG
jgi:hypothetical protein